MRRLTDYAHDRRIATDYHLNETPMLEPGGHFRHLSDNPTYIRPADWREVDALIDWLIEKNRAGYQMVNSVLAYCYNDARIIKWIWRQALNGFQGGARSLED